MEQILPKATIDNLVIQLPFRYRIKVLGKIHKQQDGMYLANGVEQFSGVIMYRNLRDVVLIYDINGKLTEIAQFEQQ